MDWLVLDATSRNACNTTTPNTYTQYTAIHAIYTDTERYIPIQANPFTNEFFKNQHWSVLNPLIYQQYMQNTNKYWQILQDPENKRGRNPLGSRACIRCVFACILCVLRIIAAYVLVCICLYSPPPKNLIGFIPVVFWTRVYSLVLGIYWHVSCKY